MQTETQSLTITQAKQDAASIFLAKVFNWMAAGLGITGLVAYGTAASGLAVRIINSPFFLIIALGTLGLVFFLSARIDVLARIAAALRRVDVRVAMAIGDNDPAALGALQPRP